jgi:hypothetical protein
MNRSATHPNQPSEKYVTLHLFLSVTCRKGDACRYGHCSSSNMLADGAALDRQSEPSTTTQPQRDSRTSVPCKYHLHGNCCKGEGLSICRAVWLEVWKSTNSTLVHIQFLTKESLPVYPYAATFMVAINTGNHQPTLLRGQSG